MYKGLKISSFFTKKQASLLSIRTNRKIALDLPPAN